jgi:UDP-N-acetyl-2-amino-2-deoxyglucuronate dehydrogenase
MYDDIVGALNNRVDYPVSAADCRDTLRLLHAFYCSDESGGWVDVDGDAESERLGRSDEAISAIYRTLL